MEFSAPYANGFGLEIRNTQGTTWNGTVVDATTGERVISGRIRRRLARWGLRKARSGLLSIFRGIQGRILVDHYLTRRWYLGRLQHLRMALGVCQVQTMLAIVWVRFNMRVTGRHKGLKLVLGLNFEGYVVTFLFRPSHSLSFQIT